MVLVDCYLVLRLGCTWWIAACGYGGYGFGVGRLRVFVIAELFV